MSDETLDRLRAEIDRADAQIVDGLAARWRAVLAIAAHKRARGIAAHDPAREGSLRARWISRAQGAGAPESLASAVFDAVIERCREAVRAAADRASEQRDERFEHGPERDDAHDGGEGEHADDAGDPSSD